jgi:putative NADH-flavin reductase
MAKRRIVLLGATGFTGNRVLRELLAAGETPTLVGRNRAKMSAAAARLGAELPVVEVDVTSAEDLERVLTSNDVALSTVGPFMKFGVATVTAAAHAGAHYFDSTGEATFARRVFDLDSVAVASGATLVPAFGYDYVPGNLAGALALDKAGRQATQVEVGYFLTRAGRGDELQYRSTLRDVYTLTTGGTRATLVGASSENALAYRPTAPGAPASLHEERAGRRAHAFEFAGVTRTGMSVGGSEHLGLPESFPQLQTVDVYLGWLGRWTRPVRAMSTLMAPFTRSEKAKATLAQRAEHLPGADREPDTDGRSLVLATARDASGHVLAKTGLIGPDPYEMTGSLLAWGAIHAADPGAHLAPGAHGPVAAFGLATLLEGAAAAGLKDVSDRA